MEFIAPPFNPKKDFAAVYKIIIDTKWFYVGSSINVRKRILRWKWALSSGRGFKNKNIRLILNRESTISFSILEVVDNVGIIRDRENYYLSALENDFMLNRCPDANSPKNLKPYFGYEPRINISGPQTPKKPVAQFGKNGKLIAQYPSIGAACKALKINSREITDYIKGKKGPFKGNTFKLISEDGSYITGPIFKKKSPPGNTLFGELSKEKYIGSNSPVARKVSMYSKNGIFIKEFGAVVEAAREFGISSQNIHAAISGFRPSAKGYIWKYSV